MAILFKLWLTRKYYSTGDQSVLTAQSAKITFLLHFSCSLSLWCKIYKAHFTNALYATVWNEFQLWCGFFSPKLYSSSIPKGKPYIFKHFWRLKQFYAVYLSIHANVFSRTFAMERLPLQSHCKPSAFKSGQIVA